MKKISFNTPLEAFYSLKVSKTGDPLFENQADLAHTLISTKNTGYTDKNPSTVRSSLSFVFTGERSISKNLCKALFTVIEPKFDKEKFDFESFKNDLQLSFASVYETKLAEKRKAVGDIDYLNLISRTKSGQNFIITTLSPAELHTSILADQLKAELLQKIEIVDKESPDMYTPGKFKFYLPNEIIARRFWDGLRNFAMKEYGFNEALINEKLKIADSNGYLNTFIVSEKIALYPFIIIDYEKAMICDGFCVSHRGSTPSVAQLTAEHTLTWLSVFKDELDQAKPFKFDI